VTTNKTSGFSRSQIITVTAGLLVIGIGGVIIFSQGPLQADKGTAGPVVNAATLAYAGPSTHGYVAKPINVNMPVRVICTVYGEPLPFGTKNALWDYTDHGWLNDHYITTGATGPTAPGCTGTTSNPSPGTDLPTKASGPYAVIAAVPVRTQPTSTAPTETPPLAAGTFVRLQCTIAKGPVIPAPRALGPGASNNVWDQVVNPVGWVPDSYVDTYSLTPVAPACL
jgi:hypothetical protein